MEFSTKRTNPCNISSHNHYLSFSFYNYYNIKLIICQPFIRLFLIILNKYFAHLQMSCIMDSQYNHRCLSHYFGTMLFYLTIPLITFHSCLFTSFIYYNHYSIISGDCQLYKLHKFSPAFLLNITIYANSARVDQERAAKKVEISLYLNLKCYLQFSLLAVLRNTPRASVCALRS